MKITLSPCFKSWYNVNVEKRVDDVTAIGLKPPDKDQTTMCDILVADDELAIRKSCRDFFEREGFCVRTAKNGDEALVLFRKKTPDILLLDVMMPKTNGIVVCEEIRKTDKVTPILFFTAMPSDITEVRGLGLGADDYIDKSDGLDIVLARVQRAISRVAAFSEATVESRRKIRLGHIEIDFDALTATGPKGETRLSKTEADMLYLLSSDRGRFFSRDEIAEVVRNADCSDGLLTTHVSRVRRKLGAAGDLIISERGIGYKLLA